MKYKLPSSHALSEKIIANLMFNENDSLILTDAQYAALEAGLGKGESLLILSPTSTGKTQIAVWAIANALENGLNAVYLVTHRALAKQKFQDFQDMLLSTFLGGDPLSIVLATGDSVIDCRGDIPADPLSTPLLVATYEKYLAMISSTGVPSSMDNTVVICDEIQLLGDKNRGQNVEVLLTLMKNAGWRQFVGLSAVLEKNDGVDLSNWLNVKLVRSPNREKNLRYEYWGEDFIERVLTSSPSTLEKASLPSAKGYRTLEVLEHLSTQSPSSFPAIVFCMKKDDIYKLAESEYRKKSTGKPNNLSIDFDSFPSTSTMSLLSKLLPYKIAIHCADLTDDERKIVEDCLVKNEIDIVFATSTLAAGVNFPLGSAIFHSWTRWDSSKRMHIPIDASEFHNMAGRVGRMGAHHEEGRVVFFPVKNTNFQAYKAYLNLNDMPPITCRINEASFDKLSLQLVSAGLCHDRDSVNTLICSSFSGLREEDNNTLNFSNWPKLIAEAIDFLIDNKMLIQQSDETLLATSFGKAVSYSGFRPISAVILTNYFIDKAPLLSNLLETPLSKENIDRFSFIVFSAAFSTPEFNSQGGVQPSRFLPWQLKDIATNPGSYASDLLEPTWYANPAPTSAAWLALGWINGELLSEQEKTHSDLRAGSILDMYRNLGWSLQGIASIISSITDSRTPAPLRPQKLRENSELLYSLRKIPRVITRLNFRISSGLPDDVLWMEGLNRRGERFKLTREEILKLRKTNMISPESLVLGTEEADKARCAAFSRIKPSPKAKSNWLRDRCRSWKSDQRAKASERHQRRAKGCSEVQLIENFYLYRGTSFEEVYESILTHLGICFEKLDNGNRVGAPDYLITFENSPPIVMELKSKEGDKLVGYNDATEVLSASEIHGYKDNFCVTLCHPGVDPSVPMNITSCGRLCVVESHDFGEALLRYCKKSIRQEQLWNWLASPGQALSDDLPFTEHFDS
ncbi:DEAD/DEAH box helicase [Hahella sp. KA22]|uniref:DEAD/DEAH box helicase n=1 Tax=Hahella sp. KA22 TaxID=1628392 RepID=UPI000FDE91A4|nr:DEAD/DEAH box helicase [Hahella sp. KA22]AZZ92555.1 DEAD/DEAH box helicase [Hahella sp. KA22]QAY55928.1 DEAD/DEAH box helicase [Hahella sp. KA22]